MNDFSDFNFGLLLLVVVVVVVVYWVFLVDFQKARFRMADKIEQTHKMNDKMVTYCQYYA
jgi:hypothetical protein